MTTKTEGQHAAEFIVSQAHGGLSREAITVLSGENLEAGEVVGRVTKGVGKAAIPTVVGTGDGVMSALFAGPEVEKGSYVVTCITAVANAGVFSVTTPSGKLLADATVAVAYRSRHVNFLIADGSADFIVGDVFTIVVTTGVPAAVGTGDGAMSALSLGPDAKTGQYRVECIAAVTNGGEFKVVGPDGDEVAVGFIVAGAGGVLVLANQRQVNLTLTEATDYVVGDFYEIFVFNELAGGKVAEWDPTTFDGRDDVAGVLYGAVDASAADKAGVIVARNAEVRKADLQFAAAITAGQKESAYLDLEALGIAAR